MSFRKPTRAEALVLGALTALVLTAVGYAVSNGLSLWDVFTSGALASADGGEMETPLSWNVPLVFLYVALKGGALGIELLPYWMMSMLIAAALVLFLPFSVMKKRLGTGGPSANLLATGAGAITPICSCGVVPLLGGIVEGGIPLGPAMAFLVAAPMLNVPSLLMTAGVLGWELAAGRVLGTVAIAMTVGTVLSVMQRRERALRRFVKIPLTPVVSDDLVPLAKRVVSRLIAVKRPLPVAELAPGEEEGVMRLAEIGLLDHDKSGNWFVFRSDEKAVPDGCGDPTDSPRTRFGTAARQLLPKAWDLFLKLSRYLLLALAIGAALKVLLPPSVVVALVGGKSLLSVVTASAVAFVAYICTHAEVPTALALTQMGMGGGATLAYLLGGPGLSLPSIAILTGVFRARVIAIYVGVSFVLCITAGTLFNLVT